TGDRPVEGLILGNLANLQLLEGRLQEAIGLQEQALAIHREVGARLHEGLALTNLATAHALQGRLEEARGLFRRALDIYRESPALRLEAVVLMNLGGTYADEARYDEAQAYYEQASAIFERIGDRQHITSCLRARAVVERQSRGNLEEAGRLLREALSG